MRNSLNRTSYREKNPAYPSICWRSSSAWLPSLLRVPVSHLAEADVRVAHCSQADILLWACANPKNLRTRYTQDCGIYPGLLLLFLKTCDANWGLIGQPGFRVRQALYPGATDARKSSYSGASPELPDEAQRQSKRTAVAPDFQAAGGPPSTSLARGAGHAPR